MKLFGRAFQIYDDVINLVEEKFCKMKNGLGEDITEGKISFPIIYCVSRIHGKRMSVHDLNANQIENEDDEDEEEDLLELVNSSNIYHLSKSLSEQNKKPTYEDLKNLFEILKQKTNDMDKITEAINILKSKNKIFLI